MSGISGEKEENKIYMFLFQNGKVFVRVTVARMKKLGKNMWW